MTSVLSVKTEQQRVEFSQPMNGILTPAFSMMNLSSAPLPDELVAEAVAKDGTTYFFLDMPDTAKHGIADRNRPYRNFAFIGVTANEETGLRDAYTLRQVSKDPASKSYANSYPPAVAFQAALLRQCIYMGLIEVPGTETLTDSNGNEYTSFPTKTQNSHFVLATLFGNRDTRNADQSLVVERAKMLQTSLTAIMATLEDDIYAQLDRWNFLYSDNSHQFVEPTPARMVVFGNRAAGNYKSLPYQLAVSGMIADEHLAEINGSEFVNALREDRQGLPTAPSF